MTRLITPWRAVAAAFALNGAMLGSWAARIPAVVDLHALSEGQLGILLLCMGLGALVSFPVAGRLTDQLGAVRLTRWIAVAHVLALVAVAMAPSVAALAVALAFFGACHGAMDVAMNAWAAEVERAAKKPIMASFHAMWSFGAGAGAAGGAAAVALGLGVPAHFWAAALAVALILGPFMRLDWTSDRRPRLAGAPVFALPRGALVLVGLVALSAGLGEGAMVDWSAIYLRETIGAPEARAAMGYVLYSVTMVAMRLCVDRLVARVGPVAVARGSGLAATLGLALVIGPLAETAALAGFVLMGVGYAAIIPLAFSRAAADPHVPPGQAIASVATLGYGALLMGPPAIGLVAEAVSLRAGFALLAGFAVLIAALAPVLRRA